MRPLVPLFLVLVALSASAEIIPCQSYLIGRGEVPIIDLVPAPLGTSQPSVVVLEQSLSGTAVFGVPVVTVGANVIDVVQTVNVTNAAGRTCHHEEALVVPVLQPGAWGVRWQFRITNGQVSTTHEYTAVEQLDVWPPSLSIDPAVPTLLRATYRTPGFASPGPPVMRVDGRRVEIDQAVVLNGGPAVGLYSATVPLTSLRPGTYDVVWKIRHVGFGVLPSEHRALIRVTIPGDPGPARRRPTRR